MAELDIEMRDIVRSKFGLDTATSFANIRDGEVIGSMGIIQLGVIPVPIGGVAGTLKTWNAESIASDLISGYRKLTALTVGLYATRTVTFIGSPIPEGELTIEEYATDVGDMDGIDSNNSTETVGVRARKVPDASEVNKVRVEIYHRTTGATETLLGSFTTPDLTGSFVDYTGDVTINRSWGTNERLVVKFVGINEGIPA